MLVLIVSIFYTAAQTNGEFIFQFSSAYMYDHGLLNILHLINDWLSCVSIDGGVKIQW